MWQPGPSSKISKTGEELSAPSTKPPKAVLQSSSKKKVGYKRSAYDSFPYLLHWDTPHTWFLILLKVAKLLRRVAENGILCV